MRSTEDIGTLAQFGRAPLRDQRQDEEFLDICRFGIRFSSNSWRDEEAHEDYPGPVSVHVLGLRFMLKLRYEIVPLLRITLAAQPVLNGTRVLQSLVLFFRHLHKKSLLEMERCLL